MQIKLYSKLFDFIFISTLMQVQNSVTPCTFVYYKPKYNAAYFHHRLNVMRVQAPMYL